MKSLSYSGRFSFSKLLLSIILSMALLFSISSCRQDEQPSTVPVPSNEEITETIQSQLDSSSHIPGDSVKVTVQDGIVTLSGTAANLLAKNKAIDIAEGVKGVLAVVNNVKTISSRSDEAIDEDIDRAIATDPATEGWKITADVSNGVVNLTGIAESWQEKQLVSNITKRVKGVKEVNNNIIIESGASRSDTEIQAEIKETFKLNSGLRDDMIDISVKNGNVILDGAVGSAREKSLAKELSHVTGVSSVSADNLEVHPEYKNEMLENTDLTSLTGSEIESAIHKAYTYDPRVPADSIDISVDNGTVILAGKVENLNSKRAATNDALNTAGVSSVQNNISVEHRIVVTPAVPTTDRAIKSRIIEAVDRDPYVETGDISVTVNNGIAVISGTVRSEFEKQQVEDVTANVKGVIEITNNLEVEDSGHAAGT